MRYRACHGWSTMFPANRLPRLSGNRRVGWSGASRARGLVMWIFRVFLFGIIAVVGVYTTSVLASYGILVLLPNFFGEMSQLNWQGQFNLDFFMFLLLSGFWIAWRNQFSLAGVLLGIGGVVLGAPYLAAYLLFLSFKLEGDVPSMLLGERSVRR